MLVVYLLAPQPPGLQSIMSCYDIIGMPAPPGIDKSSPRKELIRVLDIGGDNRVIDQIKHLWKGAARMCLNPNQRLAEQREGFRLFKKRLKKQCKLFVEGENAEAALYLTLLWAYRSHNNDFWRSRTRNSPEGIDQQVGRRLNPSRADKQKGRAIAQIFHERSPSPSLTLAGDGDVGRWSQHFRPLNNPLDIDLQSQPSSNSQGSSSLSTVSNTRASSIRHRRQVVDLDSSSCTATSRPPPPQQNTAIAHLLANCTPPMVHLLPVFEKLGFCAHEDYLLSASSYSPTTAQEFLQKVAEMAETMAITVTIADLLELREAFSAPFRSRFL